MEGIKALRHVLLVALNVILVHAYSTFLSGSVPFVLSVFVVLSLVYGVCVCIYIYISWCRWEGLKQTSPSSLFPTAFS